MAEMMERMVALYDARCGAGTVPGSGSGGGDPNVEVAVRWSVRLAERTVCERHEGCALPFVSPLNAMLVELSALHMRFAKARHALEHLVDFREEAERLDGGLHGDADLEYVVDLTRATEAARLAWQWMWQRDRIKKAYGFPEFDEEAFCVCA